MLQASPQASSDRPIVGLASTDFTMFLCVSWSSRSAMWAPLADVVNSHHVRWTHASVLSHSASLPGSRRCICAKIGTWRMVLLQRRALSLRISLASCHLYPRRRLDGLAIHTGHETQVSFLPQNQRMIPLLTSPERGAYCRLSDRGGSSPFSCYSQMLVGS